MKKEKQLFNFLSLAVILFFFIGFLPALRFNDRIRTVVETVNKSKDLSVETIKKNLQFEKAVVVQQQDKNIILKFKKPDYIFLYVNEEAETQFKMLLPQHFYVKIAG